MSRFQDPVSYLASPRLAEHLASISRYDTGWRLLKDRRIVFKNYRCSTYNWRTGRLSRESFEAVFAGVKSLLA